MSVGIKGIKARETTEEEGRPFSCIFPSAGKKDVLKVDNLEELRAEAI